MEAIGAALELGAEFRLAPDDIAAALRAELRAEADLVRTGLALVVDVIEGMRAEGVAIGGERLPVRRPGVVERAVAVDGLFVGEEESGPDAVPAQRVGNQLSLAHAAGVERQVDRALARARIDAARRRHGERAGSEGHDGGH